MSRTESTEVTEVEKVLMVWGLAEVGVMLSGNGGGNRPGRTAVTDLQ